MADAKEKNSWTKEPFLVIHDGDKRPVAGFPDGGSARDDAAARNARAEKLGIKARYEVLPN